MGEVSICQLQEREYTSLVGMHIRTNMGEVSICQLQEREYTSLVGMHIRTSLERMCSQREAWIAQEGQLVQGMLQLASKISWKTQH
jgi:hypothetical protein